VRTATVVKQRDIAKNGTIGFRLDTVVLGQNQHGEDVTTCTVSPVADAEAKPRRSEAKLAPKAATLLHTIKNLDPNLFEEVRPYGQQGFVCKAIQRPKLRDFLIDSGWFSESEISLALGFEGANSKLTKAGYTIENNWLTSLKDKRFINFTRHWIWLL
jgi:hypothetical protein